MATTATGFGSRRPGVPKYVRRVFDGAGQCPKDQPGPSGQPLIALQGPRSPGGSGGGLLRYGSQSWRGPKVLEAQQADSRLDATFKGTRTARQCGIGPQKQLCRGVTLGIILRDSLGDILQVPLTPFWHRSGDGDLRSKTCAIA